MKTNQLMTRKMGDFNVYQRTSDGMFNATALLNQWNKANGMDKKMNDFLDNKSTKEFIETLKVDQKSDVGITASADYQQVTNLNNVINIKKGGDPKKQGTWMNPYLFIDFSMWINPVFKLQVLKFVHDEMIKYRNLAGDAYNEMKTAVYPILLSEFKKEGAVNKLRDLAKSLNIIVYGKHENEMRNKVGDEERARELYELEQNIAQWVKLGLINNYDDLKKALTRLYYQKYPNVLPL